MDVDRMAEAVAETTALLSPRERREIMKRFTLIGKLNALRGQIEATKALLVLDGLRYLVTCLRDRSPDPASLAALRTAEEALTLLGRARHEQS